jgi:hypothetical protein
MTQYDNTNTGMLSRNDRQEPGSKQPDFKGFCDIEGTEYWISGWTREAGPNSKNPGRKFFSLRFEPKNPLAQAAAPATGGQAPAAPYDDSDLPF